MTKTTSKRKTKATLVGAVVAAFIASACCILPAVLALVGLSGVGLAAALAPYRPWFLAGTAVLLGAGFYLVHGRRRKAIAGEASADACGCAVPRVARSSKALLWLATVLVVGFAAYPYVAGAAATTSQAGSTAPVDRAVTGSRWRPWARRLGLAAYISYSHVTQVRVAGVAAPNTGRDTVYLEPGVTLVDRPGPERRRDCPRPAVPARQRYQLAEAALFALRLVYQTPPLF